MNAKELADILLQHPDAEVAISCEVSGWDHEVVTQTVTVVEPVRIYLYAGKDIYEDDDDE